MSKKNRKPKDDKKQDVAEVTTSLEPQPEPVEEKGPAGAEDPARESEPAEEKPEDIEALALSKILESLKDETYVPSSAEYEILRQFAEAGNAEAAQALEQLALVEEQVAGPEEPQPSAAELLEQLPKMAGEIQEAIGNDLVAAAQSEEQLALDILGTMGLEPEHVLAGRALEDGRVRIVTKGGRKLQWPDDVERARKLRPQDKGASVPGSSNAKDFKERLADHAQERDEE